MEPVLQPLYPALAWQAGEDLDYQAMALWARLTIDVAMLLLGAVLGAAGANTYHLRRARFAQQALSPAERQAMAKHLTLTGQAGEALQIAGLRSAVPDEHSPLLAMLEAEERRAVAARLGAGGLSYGEAPEAWLEPRAREVRSSREAATQMRAQTQARRAMQLGLRVQDLARRDQANTNTTENALQALHPGRGINDAEVAEAKPDISGPGAENGPPDLAALVTLWRCATQAFEAWVKSPPAGWLAALEEGAGPLQALAEVEAALPSALPPAASTPAAARLMRTVAEELALARRVIADTRRGLAHEVSARERSLQIASTAQFALGELRESAALVERLLVEDKLARL